MRNKHSRKNTGQLAIFIILLFPVLFTLFAMSLNITLVVHDKINLQNSVDIAAYYGAMKQAEMLNAIAHINYQIRQSWKLLVWRYRVLGSVSLTHRPEWGNPALAVEREHWPQSLLNKQPGPYFFCVGHNDWGWFIKASGVGGSVNYPRTRGRRTDMLCNNMGGRINAPSVPSFSGSLGSLSGILRNITRAGNTIREQLEGQCRIYGYNSWLLGALSFSHFRADQTARKQMIYYLAKAISEKQTHLHGTDLDGGSIKKGVLKTFRKNLTFVNGKAFDETPNEPFKQFNSLSGVSPSDWLEDKPFWTLGLFADIYPGESSCEKKLNFLRQGSSVSDLSDEGLKSILSGAEDWDWPKCVNENTLCAPSAGLHKKKNFLIFYSVKAELDYKCQIFLPWGGLIWEGGCEEGRVKIKAKASAKPFGGTIGPQPMPEEYTLLPRSHGETPSRDFVELDKKFTPNYSRYPGDQFGLRSSYVHYYWAEHIQNSPHDTKNIKFYLKGNHGDDKDPLARGIIPPGVKSLLARKWEIMAVAPDIFDVTYFTILPYYMQTYFPKIKLLLENKPVNLRGGLGSYKVGNKFQWKYGVLGQYKTITGKPPQLRIDDLWFLSNYSAPRPRQPWYKIETLEHLLTGWNPPIRKYIEDTGQYEIKNSTFSLCGKNTGEDDQWGHNFGINISSYESSGVTKGKIATGCIYGGRTGYSVKMISAEFIKGLSELKNDTFPSWLPR